MYVKDLRVEPPRRWSESVDGVIWLPRLIDKTRAALAGTLGPYLYGQSPIDRSFLRAARIDYPAFTEIVAAAATDEAVLAALVARDPEVAARARRWSQNLQQRQRAFLFVLDLDDGYVHPLLRPVKPAINLLANTLTWTMKRLWPFEARG